MKNLYKYILAIVVLVVGCVVAYESIKPKVFGALTQPLGPGVVTPFNQINGPLTIGTGSPVWSLGADSNNSNAFVLSPSSTLIPNYITVLQTGEVGISSSTPHALFSVNGLPGGGINLLEIASSTSGFATGTAMIIDSNGQATFGNPRGGYVSTTTIAGNLVVGDIPTMSATNIPLLTVQSQGSATKNANGLIITGSAAGSTLRITATSTGALSQVALTAFGTSGFAALDTSDANAQTRLRIAGSDRIAVGSTATTYTNAQNQFVGSTCGFCSTARFLYTGAADTAMTAGLENQDVYFNMGQSRQHLTGTPITLQRDYRISPTTHTFSAYNLANNVITNAATMWIDGPPITLTASNSVVGTSSALVVNGTPTALASTTRSVGLVVFPSTGATSNFGSLLYGVTGFGTSTPSTSAIISVGVNPGGAASSTIRMKKLQFEGENAAGVVSCMFVVGTTPTVVAGACNN